MTPCRRRQAAAQIGLIRSHPVIKKFGQTHDLSNLFVGEGSVFPAQHCANPLLTIQALAARTADYLIAQGVSIFTSKDRDMMQPAIRKYLAPPGTYGRGIPRLLHAGMAKR